MPDDAFRELVAQAPGIGKVLEAFGLENKGRNHFTAQDRIAALGIDTTHFNPMVRPRRSIFRLNAEQVLVDDSSVGRATVKKILLAAGLIDYKCKECGADPVWRGRPLILILDHQNGRRKDHRLWNLRFLCPNCNSQQPTFAGRNFRKK